MRVVFMEPASELYDRLFIQHEGYAGDGVAAVSVNHKFSVIFDLLDEIDRMEAADLE